MTDPLEDRLRHHLAARAAGVNADPDPTAFVERSANRTPRRGLVAGGLAALTVVVAGAGVLTGVNLSGATSSPPASAPSPSTIGAGRAGAAFGPSGSAGSASPSIVSQSPYSFLFTRVSATGVTVRAYSSASTPSGGCAPVPDCSPSTTVPGPTPCPSDAMCAQPTVVPHTSGGTAGSSGSGSSGSASSDPTVVIGPNRPADEGGGTVTTVPGPTATCGQLVVEASTDRAVGTGSVVEPDSPPTGPNELVVLGTGSFGSVEGDPVSWVAVAVGDGIATVRLAVAGTSLDAMAPLGGVVVLAATGSAGLAGASVVGIDQSGATLATVPAAPATQPADTGGCTTPPTTPPTLPPSAVPPPTTTTPSTTTPSTTTTVAPSPTPTGPTVSSTAG